MVQDQHTKISGYRDLSEEEIALMNEAKEMDKACAVLVAKLRGIPNLDGRCLSIGATHLETGFMFVVKAIARPSTF